MRSVQGLYILRERHVSMLANRNVDTDIDFNSSSEEGRGNNYVVLCYMSYSPSYLKSVIEGD